MPAFPTLDRESLLRLRELVEKLHRHNGPAVPLEQLAELAESVRLNAGLTVDFEAAQSLGQPLIVVRSADAGAPAAVTQPAAEIQRLSRREREVCALISEGLANKQIAGRLNLSLATIKDHVHRILTKTGFPNRAAIAAAYHGRPQITAGRSPQPK